ACVIFVGARIDYRISQPIGIHRFVTTCELFLRKIIYGTIHDPDDTIHRTRLNENFNPLQGKLIPRLPQLQNRATQGIGSQDLRIEKESS
ncbi:MAG TPA: hypothetical protein DDZ51_00230, partial [Planctomycetaceae bacterium]|nr:hypothetical protein [Planctomycetaceae bacterium]